ncbi:hypothetical protein TSUD_295640 [Trifolium subterraneum]|uniref:TIR domain-containing protein n=1 Tax=Trifolium subterraneum TaxID=3900 RepID=A0A2Z6NF66_TRISU|nr:hypothetical protein TSUD_295640 [Trifolium subterraneum]
MLRFDSIELRFNSKFDSESFNFRIVLSSFDSVSQQNHEIFLSFSSKASIWNLSNFNSVLFILQSSLAETVTFENFVNGLQKKVPMKHILVVQGTDTRYGFTGNLYRALCDGGVHTFIDDRELHGGDEITPSLVKAIEESRIFIPVFSVNYAFSSFCLDELVHIIHCFKTKGCLVLPIFYDVEPTHVRHETESYGEAIAMHEKVFQNNKEKYNDNMERLYKWKMALNQAANLSGYHFNPRNGYESEFIQEIVKYISSKINRDPLHVVDYSVGLQSSTMHSWDDIVNDDSMNGMVVYACENGHVVVFISYISNNALI